MRWIFYFSGRRSLPFAVRLFRRRPVHRIPGNVTGRIFEALCPAPAKLFESLHRRLAQDGLEVGVGRRLPSVRRRRRRRRFTLRFGPTFRPRLFRLFCCLDRNVVDRTCRQTLRDAHDATDATDATDAVVFAALVT